MGMYEEIINDINKRIKNQPDARCATGDEIRICWLITEVERLKRICTCHGIDSETGQRWGGFAPPPPTVRVVPVQQVAPIQQVHPNGIKFKDLSNGPIETKAPDCEVPDYYCKEYVRSGAGWCIQSNCQFSKTGRRGHNDTTTD